MNLRKADKTLKRARQGQDIVPIKAHLTTTICLTNKDALVSVIRLDGISYDDKSMAQLENYTTALNNTLLNLHHPRIGVWSCMLRRNVDIDVNKDLNNAFSRDFARRYQGNVGDNIRDNNFYLAVVYEPSGIGKQSSLFKKKDTKLFRAAIEEGIDFLDARVEGLMSGLAAYKPVLLGIDGPRCSEIGRFYTDLLYFKPHAVPVQTQNLANAVFNRRLLFGHEIIEIRHHTDSTYAGVLAIKEYCENTSPDMFVELSSLPFEFNFVQSFCCVDKSKAKNLLETQRNILVSSGDLAQSQIAAIEEGLDDLISGRFSIGEHNASLIIHAEDGQQLKQYIKDAETAFQSPGIVSIREDLANEAHYLCQLPGNHMYRPRVSPITSRNFASMAPMHGTPRGKKDGNWWGKAVIPFITDCGQAYYHSNHIADTGSLGIYGMTGAGKTVLMNSLQVMLCRDNIRHVNFDKDEGSKVMIHAIGGNYYTFNIGEPTGINVFQALEPTPANIYFIVDLIELLVEGLSTNERQMVEKAVRAVYDLTDPRLRRLSALMSFLDPTVENGVSERLKEWTGHHRNGWVFDNDIDTLKMGDITGFDFTELLDHEHVRTPVVSYLLHRLMELIDGTPICIWMDEFWKLLKHEYFRESFLENQYKTIRKNEGCLILATQSPADAIRSPIARTIIEQTPTTIFVPNERASKEDYTEGFQLTEAEWSIFSPLTKDSRRFLVKQGDTSLIARLPLHGMDDELAVLSGRKGNNEVFEALRLPDGSLPDDWIAQYQRAAVK
jgi:type IV secretion system protein VirB4